PNYAQAARRLSAVALRPCPRPPRVLGDAGASGGSLGGTPVRLHVSPRPTPALRPRSVARTPSRRGCPSERRRRLRFAGLDGGVCSSLWHKPGRLHCDPERCRPLPVLP